MPVEVRRTTVRATSRAESGSTRSALCPPGCASGRGDEGFLGRSTVRQRVFRPFRPAVARHPVRVLEDEARDYLCCGVRIRSHARLPWEEVAMEGEAEITVTEGALRVGPDVDTDAVFDDGAMTLIIPGVGRFLASRGERIVIDADPTAKETDVLLYLCGSVFGAIWLQRGLLPLHGSTVSCDSGSVMFMGPSGAGKSTLAAHFARAGWRLVADDVSVIRAVEGGLGVWPGSGRVKLATDSVESIDEDAGSLPGVGGTRGKYHVPLRPSSEAVGDARLRRIYLLSGWGEAMESRPVEGLDAIDIIGGHTYRHEFIGPLGLRPTWLAEVVRVARTVPVRHLMRPHGFDHAGEVIGYVEDDLAGDAP